MTAARPPACAWCLRYGSTTCLFPGGEQCQLERRLEDMAHAINTMGQAVTGDITTRIAEIIVKHSICDCGEWAENFEENARHVAEQIVHQLKSHQGEYTMGQP